jgi:hypothetical protein
MRRRILTVLPSLSRFAMLTSKPPFQSSTTDEIYRRARDRDYEWPDPETTQKYISHEAKELVASMLQSPELRPDPDSIVNDPWFQTGFMPAQSDITPRLRELPPDKPEFYMGSLPDEVCDASYEAFREQCIECMVGSLAPTQLIHSQVWKEMAAEEKVSLTPIIPLEEGIVYRPFAEVLKEQQVHRSATGSVRSALPRTLTTEDLTARSLQPPSGLLRQPPQSFAAQQRAQGRPAMPPSPAPTSRYIAAPVVNTQATQAPAATARGPTPTALRSTSAVPRKPVQPSERQPVVERQREAAPPARETPSMRSRPRRDVQLGELPLRSRSETIPRSDSAALSRPKATAPSHVRSTSAASGSEGKVAPPERTSSSAPSTMRARTKDLRTASLFDASERPREVPDSKPDVILDRLRFLQVELERALNSRTMAIITPKTATPPPHPDVVVKWVDYTNKFGLGYILNDGSIGCVLRDIPTQDASGVALLPPVCMLIRNAERHFEHRSDETYAERHQPVPVKQNVHFFENRGESGLVHFPVPGEEFRVSVGADGQPAKMQPGSDVYQHRKRERVTLWKKFANYMVAYGRDDGMPLEGDAAERRKNARDDASAPKQVVTFYQRLGDVGCWVFADGHLQVCSPSYPCPWFRFLTRRLLPSLER